MSVLAFCACNNVKIGYLQTDSAEYFPDSLVIRTVLGDDRYDENREANNAPWVTNNISGVLGTEPLQYKLMSVKALDGTETDAKVFGEELVVRGCGKMEVPLKPAAPKGRYRVTLKVYNEDYSAILPDVFTFIIK
ncbi:hypothetical protein [Butyricimonas paravirosa]